MKVLLDATNLIRSASTPYLDSCVRGSTIRSEEFECEVFSRVPLFTFLFVGEKKIVKI